MLYMDVCLLYDDCVFLKDWLGVLVGNEEGEIILKVFGDKCVILLLYYG